MGPFINNKYVLYDYISINSALRACIYSLLIFWSVFNRQYTHFFCKNRIICNSRDLRSRVFIMILALFAYKFNRLVINKWSTYEESMYATILKDVIILGLFIHGLKLFWVLVPYGCPFALLPVLVGWRCNYLEFSLQVVKLKTKFHSPNFNSNSGVFTISSTYINWLNRLTLDIVGNLNPHTTRNYSTCRTTPCGDIEKNYNSNLKMNPGFVTGFADAESCFFVPPPEWVKRKIWK